MAGLPSKELLPWPNTLDNRLDAELFSIHRLFDILNPTSANYCFEWKCMDFSTSFLNSCPFCCVLPKGVIPSGKAVKVSFALFCALSLWKVYGDLVNGCHSIGKVWVFSKSSRIGGVPLGVLHSLLLGQNPPAASWTHYGTTSSSWQGLLEFQVNADWWEKKRTLRHHLLTVPSHY